MNKKGFSTITLIFWAIGALIVWAMFAAPIITTWGAAAITNGNLTGIEAFVYGSMNYIIGFVFLIAIMAISVYGGGSN